MCRGGNRPSRHIPVRSRARAPLRPQPRASRSTIASNSASAPGFSQNRAYSEPWKRPVGFISEFCGRQCCAVNEVRPQLDELLFPSLEGEFVESVEVTDTSVRDAGAGRAEYTVRTCDFPVICHRSASSSWCRYGCVDASARRTPVRARPSPSRCPGSPAGSAGGLLRRPAVASKAMANDYPDYGLAVRVWQLPRRRQVIRFMRIAGLPVESVDPHSPSCYWRSTARAV